MFNKKQQQLERKVENLKKEFYTLADSLQNAGVVYPYLSSSKEKLWTICLEGLGLLGRRGNEHEAEKLAALCDHLGVEIVENTEPKTNYKVVKIKKK